MATSSLARSSCRTARANDETKDKGQLGRTEEGCAPAKVVEFQRLADHCPEPRGSFDDLMKGQPTMFTIDSTIDIAASLARVHTAITTESGYRAWFTQDAEFDGKQATFRFSQPTERRSVTFQVDHCHGGGIVMTCIAHENNADWWGTTLAIELSEMRPGTRVHLIHSGYPAKNEVYERCSEAWPYFLRSLASYMMTGTGAPYPKAA
jgi:uncharacterized protein YndB with AHSA1/START domain